MVADWSQFGVRAGRRLQVGLGCLSWCGASGALLFLPGARLQAHRIAVQAAIRRASPGFDLCFVLVCLRAGR